jgi:2-phosphoglycerate kinase
LQALKLVNPGISRTITLCVTKQHPLSLAARLVVARVRHLVPAFINEGIAKAKAHTDVLGMRERKSDASRPASRKMKAAARGGKT